MLKSERVLFATSALIASIAGGMFLLSLTPAQTIQVAEQVVSRNPLAPVLANLDRPQRAYLPEIVIKSSTRDILDKVTAYIPQPPHRPKFKKAYKAIAARFTAPNVTQSSEAMAYAAPENPLDSFLDIFRRIARPASNIQAQPGLAVYKISDKTVYLPNGEQLEAHSGLGDMRDNPRYVHVKMRGPTPPHVYNLTWRESLFHGVQAIRLNPVGGSQAIYNRDGLLAHTYMLDPRGASNGCISVRDYDAFKRAFADGIIKRVAVVP